MGTRREAIMGRYAELKRIQADHEAAATAAASEMQKLSEELTSTPPDILDFDAIDQKNEALRSAGLLPPA